MAGSTDWLEQEDNMLRHHLRMVYSLYKNRSQPISADLVWHEVSRQMFDYGFPRAPEECRQRIAALLVWDAPPVRPALAVAPTPAEAVPPANPAAKLKGPEGARKRPCDIDSPQRALRRRMPPGVGSGPASAEAASQGLGIAGPSSSSPGHGVPAIAVGVGAGPATAAVLVAGGAGAASPGLGVPPIAAGVGKVPASAAVLVAGGAGAASPGVGVPAIAAGGVAAAASAAASAAIAGDAKSVIEACVDHINSTKRLHGALYHLLHHAGTIYHHESAHPQHVQAVHPQLVQAVHPQPDQHGFQVQSDIGVQLQHQHDQQQGFQLQADLGVQFQHNEQGFQRVQLQHQPDLSVHVQHGQQEFQLQPDLGVQLQHEEDQGQPPAGVEEDDAGFLSNVLNSFADYDWQYPIVNWPRDGNNI